MLLTHVQVAPNSSSNSYHVQATGPAFPTGYASGDVTLLIGTRECFIPSMRGTDRKYFLLTEAEVKANLAAIVGALGSPCPTYLTSEAATVKQRVEKSIIIAKEGPPKPAPAPVAVSSGKCDISDEKVAAIVRAVIAALKA